MNPFISLLIFQSLDTFSAIKSYDVQEYEKNFLDSMLQIH